MLVWGMTALLTAVGMEFWARVVHDRAWHGFLWSVHRSHHRKHHSRVEANDALSFTHAPIAMVLIIGACVWPYGRVADVAFGVGIGMTAFGVAYALVHDGFIHGRLPLAFLGRIPYFVRVREAHEQHHRGNAAPYGLFLGPWEPAKR